MFEMISKDVILIDGGLSTELEYLGYPVRDTSLWTAKWLVEKPEVLKKAHLNFLENGAQIIETCSYQLSIDNICKELSYTVEDAKKLIKKSVEIANQVRKENKLYENKLIAGSIGPYGACQCDGSEFDGSYVDNFTEEDLIEWHRPRFECLVNANCDLIAIETIPSIKEATALLKLLSQYPNITAWLSFSCKNETSLCYGDTFKDAFAKFKDDKQLIAIGINCTSPKYISSLLKSANRVESDLPFIVYSNDGKIWRNDLFKFVSENENENSMTAVHNQLIDWINQGTKYIGGCCNINSKNLMEMSKIIEKDFTLIKF